MTGIFRADGSFGRLAQGIEISSGLEKFLDMKRIVLYPAQYLLPSLDGVPVDLSLNSGTSSRQVNFRATLSRSPGNAG